MSERAPRFKLKSCTNAHFNPLCSTTQSAFFYGHEETTHTCARLSIILLSCLDVSLPANGLPSSAGLLPVAAFIAHAFHCTRLNSFVLSSTLFLLLPHPLEAVP